MSSLTTRYEVSLGTCNMKLNYKGNYKITESISLYRVEGFNEEETQSPTSSFIGVSLVVHPVGKINRTIFLVPFMPEFSESPEAPEMPLIMLDTESRNSRHYLNTLVREIRISIKEYDLFGKLNVFHRQRNKSPRLRDYHSEKSVPYGLYYLVTYDPLRVLLEKSSDMEYIPPEQWRVWK